MFRRSASSASLWSSKEIGESDLVYVYLHKMVVVYQDVQKKYPSFVNLYALIVQLPGVNEHHYYKVNNLDKFKMEVFNSHETLEEFLEYSLNTNYK
nr:hypothetical protein PBILCG01_0032400 [Plasmodium sp. DRC-Itaito]